MPPAAHQRASTGHAGHPVVVSTAACGRRLGGGPAPDGLFTGLIRAPERTGDTSPRHIPRPTSLRANHCVPSSVPACASLPGHGWPTPSSAVILLITGAISLLGPRGHPRSLGADLWTQLFSDVSCIALWINSEYFLTRLYSVLHWFHKRLEVNIKNPWENRCFQTVIIFSFGSVDNS